mgnify:CR=1 FL=1
MISKILNRLSIAHLTDEQLQKDYRNYNDMTEHPGWQVHQKYLVEISNAISLYMLSKEYTELSAEEKDIQQRAFFISREMIEFLLNPLKVAENMAAMKQLNKKREATPERPKRK